MSASPTELATVEAGGAPAIQDNPTSLLAAIERMARDPTVDADKLERLLAMQERMEARHAEAEFNRALHAAQMEMPRVSKRGTIELGGKGSIAFARWEDIDAVLRPIMQRHGFSLSFDSSARESQGGGAVVSGTLRHSGGHSKTASMSLPLDSGPGRNNLQAMGSTLSYGKRYVAEMLFNIVREGDDDDGKRGGTRYITEAQADELRGLARQAGRQEGQILDRMFAGAVRSFDELETGPSHIAVKNMLAGIIAQARKKEDQA